MDRALGAWVVSPQRRSRSRGLGCQEGGTDVFVTGMPRVVYDYRALNVKTVKDHTPFPRQDDIIECLARAIIRGKIDLVCTYYHILMEIVDIHKTAFKTPFGIYEWLVMPQGLYNAVATFQRYMNWILWDYIGKFCAVYIATLQSGQTQRKSMKSTFA